MELPDEPLVLVTLSVVVLIAAYLTMQHTFVMAESPRQIGKREVGLWQ